MAQSTTKAPGAKLYRTVTGNDSLPISDKKLGLSCENYKTLNVEVVPNTGETPVIAVLFWSETKGEFVPAVSAITKTAPGAGEAFQFSVDVNGQIVFIQVVSGATGETKIATSAYGLDSTL